MSGFTNADGSTLVGGQKPSGAGQALQVDTSGNLLVNVAVGGGGGGGGSVVNIADPVTSANKLAVDGSGKIGLNNFPSTQAVSGTVGVNNFPSTQAVSGTVGVNNFPSTQAVSGTVGVNNFPSTQAVSGTVGVNNFPAQQAINLDQVNGAALSVNNPVFTEDQFRAWIVNGQGFTATTGKLTAGGTITGGLSIFNPNASGKTLLVFSLLYTIGNNSFNQINLTSSDPALGTAVSAVNNKAGSGTASVATCSSANTNVTPAGTLSICVGSGSNTITQALPNSNVLAIPPNNGVVFYSNLSGANSWTVTVTWIEI